MIGERGTGTGTGSATIIITGLEPRPMHAPGARTRCHVGIVRKTGTGTATIPFVLTFLLQKAVRARLARALLVTFFVALPFITTSSVTDFAGAIVHAYRCAGAIRHLIHQHVEIKALVSPAEAGAEAEAGAGAEADADTDAEAAQCVAPLLDEPGDGKTTTSAGLRRGRQWRSVDAHAA